MGKLRHQKSSNLPKVTYLQNATAETQTLVVWLHVTTGYQKPGCIRVCARVLGRRLYHFHATKEETDPQRHEMTCW